MNLPDATAASSRAMPKVQLSTRISADLWHRVHDLSAQSGMSITEIVEDALWVAVDAYDGPFEIEGGENEGR